MPYTLDDEPELCPEPATIENGEVSYDKLNVSGKLRYECNTGYLFPQKYSVATAVCELLTNPKKRAVWSYRPGNCSIGEYSLALASSDT